MLVGEKVEYLSKTLLLLIFDISLDLGTHNDIIRKGASFLNVLIFIFGNQNKSNCSRFKIHY